ncbi:MAG: LysR family transcriptional regulator [Clostridiales Family XIII bacterium]|jgi:DNA-binding transcriptional LysR family regulator|nr:LysR family transcriptional regulator [Clostridiales Family XIII bacterium]
MDIRQLNYIITLGKHLNFTRASEELHIAQTTLSQQISVMENQMGVRLFDRNNRSVKLTPAGDIFVKEAKQLVAQYDDAIRRARHAVSDVTGKLAVGWWGDLEFTCLSEIMKKFRDRFPNIFINFYQDNLHNLIRALKTGRLNVCFIPLHLYSDLEGLEYRTVASSPLYIAVGDNHPYAGMKKLRPEVLNDEEFIILNYNNTYGAFEKTISQYNKMGFTPNIINQPLSFSEVYLMVSLGFGITVCPRDIENDALNKLHLIEVDGPQVNIDVNVAWLEGNDDPALALFKEMIEEMYA